jgi:hypothetical protein
MRTKASFAAVVTLVVLLPSRAVAWGAVTHRALTRRVIELLPAAVRPLFLKNQDEFVLRSNDPDLWRLMFDDESPNHQIDFGVEDYGTYPFAMLPREYGAAIEKFGAATIRRHGTLPWRIQELFGALRRTFDGVARGQLYAESNAIVYGAALAHYVEDAHQPLHVHQNYDGQLSGQRGVHSRFESELFERFESRLTITPAAASHVASARDVAFTIALDSFQLVPQLLAADKSATANRDMYDDAYFESFFSKVKAMLEQQLSKAVTVVASLIISAWEDAGRPQLRVGVTRPVQRVQKLQKVPKDQT